MEGEWVFWGFLIKYNNSYKWVGRGGGVNGKT